MELLQSLFTHNCFVLGTELNSWKVKLAWLYNMSDFVIGFSFLLVTVFLIYFLSEKNFEIPHRMVFFLFGCFLAICSLGYLLDLWNFHTQVYLDIVKVLTAVFSLVISLALLPVLSKALKVTYLSEINNKLKQEIEEHKKTKEAK